MPHLSVANDNYLHLFIPLFSIFSLEPLYLFDIQQQDYSTFISEPQYRKGHENGGIHHKKMYAAAADFCAIFTPAFLSMSLRKNVYRSAGFSF